MVSQELDDLATELSDVLRRRALTRELWIHFFTRARDLGAPRSLLRIIAGHGRREWWPDVAWEDPAGDRYREIARTIYEKAEAGTLQKDEWLALLHEGARLLDHDEPYFDLLYRYVPPIWWRDAGLT